MARLDTISAGDWQPGTLLTGLIADATIIVSVTQLPPGWWLLGFQASCDIAWVYDFQILDANSVLYQSKSLRQRPAAGNEALYLPSAIRLPANAQVQVKLVGAITVVGLQGALFTQMGSIG